MDARATLGAVPAATNDVVALFPPDPVTALATRFYTRGAAVAAARAVRPDGVFVLRLPWSANVPDPATLAYGRSVVRALRASFPRIVAMPGKDALPFASHDPATLTTDPGTLAERAVGRPGVDPRAYPCRTSSPVLRSARTDGSWPRCSASAATSMARSTRIFAPSPTWTGCWPT